MVEELDNLKRKCRNFLQVALEDFHHKLEDYMLEAIEKVERRCVQSWESSSKCFFFFFFNVPHRLFLCAMHCVKKRRKRTNSSVVVENFLQFFAN